MRIKYNYPLKLLPINFFSDVFLTNSQFIFLFFLGLFSLCMVVLPSVFFFFFFFL